VGKGRPSIHPSRSLWRRAWNGNRFHGELRPFAAICRDIRPLTLPQVELFLFDVSMSGVFAMVYGVLLIVAGVIIGKKSRPETLSNFEQWTSAWLCFSFAVCVVSSGFFCFALDKEWMGGLSTAVKIPMYMVHPSTVNEL